MQHTVRVKICGITRAEDALAAAQYGADAVGFVFAPSPRRVTPDQAKAVIDLLPPMVLTAGVFVNETIERMKEIRNYCRLDILQLSGDEPPETVERLGGRIFKVFGVGKDKLPDVSAYPDATMLLDTYSPDVRGGTGRTFDWEAAKVAAKNRRIILAGGLNPENVADAVRMVRPFAVDVSSGVESKPGIKDPDKIALFIERAKNPMVHKDEQE